MTYSELEQSPEFKEDKCKAYLMWLGSNYIRTLFNALQKDWVTSNMKITISVDSKYYGFNDTREIKGDKWSE